MDTAGTLKTRLSGKGYDMRVLYAATDAPSPDSKGSSAGLIVGIVFGVVAVCCAAAFAIWKLQQPKGFDEDYIQMTESKQHLQDPMAGQAESNAA